MLLDYLYTNDWKAVIIQFLLTVPVIILILSVHEYAHGLVAKKLGDHTAENFGRLTINPIKHIDPIGFIMFLLIGVGYAKPVPINSRNFKKPRRDMALVGAAGPISNVILAFIFMIIFKVFTLFLPMIVESAPEWAWTASGYFMYILKIGVLYNLVFAIFNLIPAPPLDGSRILYAFLPSKILFKVQMYERYFFYGILLIMLIFSILGISIIGNITDFFANLLFRLFRMPAIAYMI